MPHQHFDWFGTAGCTAQTYATGWTTTALAGAGRRNATDLRLITGDTAIFPGARYGLGIMQADDSCGGYWAHPGNVPGTTTINGASPDGTRVVVLSLNTALANPIPVYQRTSQLIDEKLCS